MRRAVLSICVGVALYCIPAAAQQPAVLQPGRTRGSLGSGDATLSGGEFTDTYTITGRAGQRFIIRLTATAFDPYLLMRGPSGFTQDNDDEATGSTAAKLDVRLPVDGTYRLVATSYRAGESGDYELEVQEATGGAAAPAPSMAAAGGGTITLGQTAQGTLAAGDQAMSSGELYDTWRFQGRQGQRVVVRLVAGDFDPYLLARGPGSFSEDNDDDNTERGSKNSRLEVTLPATGEYRFVATSYRSGESGAYTISVQDASAAATTAAAAAAPRPAAGAPIALGQTAQGRLENGDPQLRSGEFMDAYSFQGSRGQQLDIRLTSTEFDPYVQIAGPGSYSAYNDDDVDGGTSNSHLVVTLPADGAYRIVATSFRAGESGAYRLSVGASSTVTASAGSAASAAMLTLGRSVDGLLDATDDTLASGERVDRFAFQGRPGQRLAVDMTSRNFDTFVQMVAPSGRLEENDDAGQSTTDSRLESVLTEDGTYTILATSLSRGMVGGYRLGIASLDAARSTTTAAAPGAAPSAAPAGAALALGTPQAGRLQTGDQALPSGEFVDRYSFDGRRGQVITVEMTSTELDPYLMVVAPGGAQQENDDASTTDRNARVTWALPADGRYTVMATTYRPGEAGSYSVRVSTGAAAAAAVAARPTTPATGARGQRVWAVLVGISDYGSRERNLAYTAEDAVKMGQALTRAGVLAQGSVVLTDADATYERVRGAFQQVAAQAGPEDVFLFFYSGHGTQLRENAANTAEPDLRDEGIVLRDRIVTDDEMGQWFRAVRSRMAIIALDACFSGGFARDVVNRPGVMGFFSSEEDLTSAVAGKFEAGGYLSHFLRGGLSGEADADRNNSVTAGELSTYVQRMFRTQASDVAAETSERQRNYQFPVIDRGGVKIDDVVLAIAR